MTLGPRAGRAPPPLDRDSIEMRGEEDAGQQAERVSGRDAPRDTRLIESVRKVKGATSEHHRSGARARQDRAFAMTGEHGRPERRAGERLHEVPGLAAREVDPVRV